MLIRQRLHYVLLTIAIIAFAVALLTAASQRHVRRPNPEQLAQERRQNIVVFVGFVLATCAGTFSWVVISTSIARAKAPILESVGGACACLSLVGLVLWGVHHPAARGTNSPANVCGHNLRAIDSAKREYSLTLSLSNEASVYESNLIKYIRGGLRKCPSGGKYSLGKLDEFPTCSVHHSLTNL